MPYCVSCASLSTSFVSLCVAFVWRGSGSWFPTDYTHAFHQAHQLGCSGSSSALCLIIVSPLTNPASRRSCHSSPCFLLSASATLSPFTDALATHSFQWVISTNITHLNVVTVLKNTTAYGNKVEPDRHVLFGTDVYTISHKSIYIIKYIIFWWDNTEEITSGQDHKAI